MTVPGRKRSHNGGARPCDGFLFHPASREQVVPPGMTAVETPATDVISLVHN